MRSFGSIMTRLTAGWQRMVLAALTVVSFSHEAKADLTLNVPQIAQTQSNWCWAASGEMVMDYLGTNVSQCDEANKRLNRTDCCNSPTPSACNSPGWPEFDKYYFNSTYLDGTLSWSSLKTEIDNKRPVAFSWHWDGTNTGHMMVARGYKTVNSVNYVDINDPNNGQSSISYTAYTSGNGYTHWRDYYNISDKRVCNADFYGVSSSSFQDCFNYWAQRGRYPVTLSAYQLNGGTYFTGSFQAVTSRPVWALMSLSTFTDKFNYYKNLGWRPEHVTVLSTSSGPLYTAIWAPIDGTFYTYVGMTESDMSSKWSSFYSQGYVNIDIFPYEDNGTKYAATWVKRSTGGYATYTNMTASDYSTRFQQFTASGYQTRRFVAYNTSSGTRYAAIWEKRSGGFYHYYNMTAADFQSKYNTLTASGYRLFQVSALADRFSAIWN